MFSTIPMEFHQFLDPTRNSNAKLSTLTGAVYMFSALFFFRNIPVYMFSTIPMETSQFLDPTRDGIAKLETKRKQLAGERTRKASKRRKKLYLLYLFFPVTKILLNFFFSKVGGGSELEDIF